MPQCGQTGPSGQSCISSHSRAVSASWKIGLSAIDIPAPWAEADYTTPGAGVVKYIIAGTILCRPREREARVAVSRTYLRRHGRLLRKEGEDASTHRAVLRARC